MKMTRELGVSRSGYYAWLKRKPCKRDMEEMRLLELIKNIFKEHYKEIRQPEDMAGTCKVL